MNAFFILGNIIKEPKVSYTSNDVKMCKLTVAVETNKDDQIFEVLLFNSLADIEFQEGQVVGITGKLSANEYEYRGKKYKSISLIGNSVSIAKE